MPSTKTHPSVRFWNKVDKNGPLFQNRGRCWIWTGGTDRKGYGRFAVVPKSGQSGEKSLTTSAHRFAFEEEHVAISKKIAEVSLLPALKALSPHTPIIANGLSCRQQIQYLGYSPIHLANFLIDSKER